MDVSNLSRFQKGYLYEYDIWYSLDIHNVEYTSNPQIYSEWLKTTNTGYDLTVNTPKGKLKVECKFTTTPIFHSWFIRDWYSRDADIIVTSNKWNLSSGDRELLKEKRVKLFNDYEFLWYILKLHRHHNKYYLNYISRFISTILNFILACVNLGKSTKSKHKNSTKTNENSQLKNDTLFDSTFHRCPSTTRESVSISSKSLSCHHIKSMGFSSYHTPLSGLEGDLT